MKRVFLYCRVSIKEQSPDDHYSLALQAERSREYAKKQKWRVAEVRKDVGSGRDALRLGFQRLLADVSAQAIDVVIVYRLDRLSRNVRDVYEFPRTTHDANVGSVSTSESFDTTTAMGQAMLGAAALFGQLTREVIARRILELFARQKLGLTARRAVERPLHA